MTDVPDDLTSVGRHHGNDPPTETGQEVRSPDGPDPNSAPAAPTPALFQVVRAPDGAPVQIRVHSPRAEVAPPEDETDELGQYRSVSALREALSGADIDGWTAVFEDGEADRVLTDTDVTPDHAWIGRPRYDTITLFPDPEAAEEYVSGLSPSTDPSDE
jgi:hypothetical protein